ncbi:MAG: NAD(P)/FAD-dependent oxidoreductase [Chitinophagaceae bacterium]
MNLSFWEQQSFLNYDHILIGGGMVGLSTAISLKEKRPNDRVLILERGILPTGASTKNAGFACIGSPTEIWDDLQKIPLKEVLTLLERRWKGLAALRKRLGDQPIQYQQRGSYELIREGEWDILEHLDELNDLLYPILGAPAFYDASHKIPSFGFNPLLTSHLIENHFEGELNTGKMMRALVDFALMKGVEIKTGCEVSRFVETEKEVHVILVHPYLGEDIAFCARNLVLCTNAFTRTILPELLVQPGRGHIILTEPIPNLPFCGIFHFDRGYYYFRELEGRILFGGGRNLDFEQESTSSFQFNPRILADLNQKLKEMIIPGTSFKIAHQWTGIMGFAPTKIPLIGSYSARVFMGIGMGGMGIALGTEAGECLARQILGENPCVFPLETGFNQSLP